MQIPAVFGGLDGEAIFIDTEGSFIVERLADMAKAAISHCQLVTKQQRTPGKITHSDSMITVTI